MRVDPAIISWLLIMVDDPKIGVKLTAGRIDINRVTLWRIIHRGTASPSVARRLATFATSNPIKTGR